MQLIYFIYTFFLQLYIGASQNVPPNPFIFPNLKIISDFSERQPEQHGGGNTCKNPNNHQNTLGDEEFSKRNVVLFLVHTLGSPSNTEILQLLNFEEKTRIPSDNYVPRSIRVPLRSTRNVKTCEELLKLSLLSLINYCRVGLGMTTAVASVSNDTLYNEIKEKSDQEPETHRSADNDVLSLPKAGETLPMVVDNAIPDDFTSNFKKINMKSVPAYKPGNILGFDRYGDVVTADEQRDSFNIRSKRNEEAPTPPIEDSSRRNDIPGLQELNQDNKSFWGIMDVITDTKFSFFGRVFGKDIAVSNTDEPGCPDKIGQVKDTSLFQVVKDTLTSLQNKDSAYLMIVIGGDMMEFGNKDSQLSQSVKHVIENDPSKSTLFVISGLCQGPTTDANQPEGFNGGEIVVSMGEGYEAGGGHAPSNGNQQPNSDQYQLSNGNQCGIDQNSSIPIFAKGSGSSILCQCTQLYEVPLLIKRILKESPPECEHQINKRSIIHVRNAESPSSKPEISWEIFWPVIIAALVFSL